MSASTRKKQAAGRSRRAILDLLKQEGPRDAQSLARNLGISAMAVRQHLYDLEGERLVTFAEEPRPVGRPAKLWRLTPAADRFFPDGHAELVTSLLGAMGEAFGAEGLDRLLEVRRREQTAAYARRVPAGAPLEARLEALAELRTEEGYMAGIERRDGNAFLLVENHCPICAAARACSGLCRMELEVFQAVLGDDVQVERTDHILAGARRCAYRVRPVTAS